MTCFAVNELQSLVHIAGAQVTVRVVHVVSGFEGHGPLILDLKEVDDV